MHASMRQHVPHALLRAASAPLAAAIACALLLPCLGRAAPAPDPAANLRELSIEELMDVEVTSVSRRPEKLGAVAAAIQVITADDIRRSGATSLPEALRLADNLDVAQKNAHDWAITARGFNTELANKLLVLIDGRTVYTPLFSGVFWDRQNVLLEDVERIEVISGPGGTQWGANAVNGVINVITRSARDTQGGYAEVLAGDEVEGQAGARYGARIAPDTWLRVYATGSRRGASEFADGSAVHDAWSRRQGGFRIDSAPDAATTLTVQGDAYGSDQDLATGRTARVSGANLLGRWTRSLERDGELRLQAYYDRTHLDDPIPALIINGAPFAPAGTLVDDLDTFDLDFQHSVALSERQHVVWGLGYRRTRDEVRNAPGLAFYPPTLTQDLYSAFALDEIRLRDDLRLTLGTKVEHNDYTGTEVEPSARLQCSVADGQTLWTAVSRAVRTPSRIDRDLAEPDLTAPLVILRGSQEFRSETVVAHELGYRAAFGARASASLTLFYNDYDRIRSTAQTPTTILPFFFANDLRGETYGVELSSTWQVRDRWRLQLGYAWLEQHLRVKPGGEDFNQTLNETGDPAHRLTLRSSADLTEHLTLDAAWRWVGNRPQHNATVRGSVPHYDDLDVRLAWRASDALELSLVGQNLLHARHPEFGFPGAQRIEIERAYYAKATWRF